MANALHSFDKRARAVEASHRKLAKGYVTKMDRNGTIRHKAVGRFRIVSPRAFVYLLGVFWVFKGYLFHALGAEEYILRLQGIDHATLSGKIGGLFMAADPATQWIAGAFQAVL